MSGVGEKDRLGWDEPPLPLKSGGKPAVRAQFRQLSLLHIMISLVYFAVLFWAARLALNSSGPLPKVFLGVVTGLGFCLVGLWGALTLPRFSFVGWILFVIGYTTVTGATATFFAVPTLPILIGSIIYLNLRRRSNEQDGLLWVLAVASGRGLPLAPGVDVFASQSSGMYRVWAGALADLLRAGSRLPDALDDIPKLVPRRCSLLIRMGWESGHLALGLREAVEVRESRRPALRAVAGRLAYLGWVTTFGMSVVVFIMYFVVPKFEAIFKDFGVELPGVTRSVIRASHVAVDFGWVGSLAILAALIYAIIALFGSGEQGLPVFDRLFPRRHRALILRSLALAVSAGRPIPAAFETLSRHYPAGWVRKKLATAAADAAQGVPWVEALSENGLLSPVDAGVLVSAQRAGNLAWALRELAESGERRWAYRLQAWTQVLFALAMISLGVVVLFLAVAFFAPLITLISRLAE